MASASSSYPPGEIDEEVTLDVEEFGGLSLDVEEEEEEYDVRWCLVGRFLNVRVIDVQAMQHMMAFLWKPVKGLYVKELEQNRFLFQFYHELDIKRVIGGSPWTFERKQLIFERLKVGDNLRTITLNRLDLWVQIHDLQHGFRTEKTIQRIGGYIGKFVESDRIIFPVWREYFKVRVTISLDQPLKRRMKIRRLNISDWFWVNFKYEHAPTFCFICGLIGHADKLCPRLFETSEESIVKPYGVFMRATTQRQNKLIRSQWLRSGRKEKYGEEQSSAARRNGGGAVGITMEDVKVHRSGSNGENWGRGEDLGIDDPIIVHKFGAEYVENNGDNIDINMTNDIGGDTQVVVDNELVVFESKRKRLGSVGPDNNTITCLHVLDINEGMNYFPQNKKKMTGCTCKDNSSDTPTTPTCENNQIFKI
ncbi:hypothetical protein F8388_019312 [Cannabis sativa]|uniref:CCHC-type domain-containing protein n=1 Tax=Cannabis sativa TaxID=3483 RepID=A0A7J6FTG5_CANSA|nr:hypothetical protein F8388_019312 [Cannabis sativa]KAF4388333.1 hypothetical protein G4B88_013170 [Cannabis sativa]